MARLFIVEGEDHGAEELSAALRAAGHEVVGTALASFEAYERVPRARPELAVVDLRSRCGGDAVELACELRRRFDLPALFVSGVADLAAVRRAGRADPVGFLPRPWDDKQLRAALELGLQRIRREATRRGSDERQAVGERLALLGTLSGGLTRALNGAPAPGEVRALADELSALGRSTGPLAVPLQRAVERALRAAGEHFAARANFDLRVEASPWVEADEGQIARAIGHLLVLSLQAHGTGPGVVACLALGSDAAGQASVQIEISAEPGAHPRPAGLPGLSAALRLALADAIVSAHGGRLEHPVGSGPVRARILLPAVAAPQGLSLRLSSGRTAVA